MTIEDGPTARGPLRADARRNQEKLLVAATAAFAELGASAALEEIARRAGVGVATLYRNFPTRADLFDAVYVHEVDVLCEPVPGATSGDTAETAAPPEWAALTAWLLRFVAFIGAKRAFAEEMAHDTPIVERCRARIYATIEPLLRDAQHSEVVRPDVSADDVLRMLSGIGLLQESYEGQLQKVAAVALDGLRQPLDNGDSGTRAARE